MRLGYALSYAMAVVVAFMRFRYLKETIENESGIGWDVPRIFRKSYMGIFASIRWLLGNLRGYAVIAVLLIFISSIVQPFWIASNVRLADTIPKSSRGRVMATLGQGIGVGISGGGYAQGFLLFIPATIGSFVGGYIYESSPSLPWLIQAAVLALGMALVFAFVREPGRREA